MTGGLRAHAAYDVKKLGPVKLLERPLAAWCESLLSGMSRPPRPPPSPHPSLGSPRCPL